MSVVGVMLIKDEADIIGPLVKYLSRQVDHVIVCDNMSTDGTSEILTGFQDYENVEVREDPIVAYEQSQKTTALALEAYERGFGWVLPCDADEAWYAPDRRTISEILDGVPPDAQMVSAQLFNHIPSSDDDERLTNPFQRIGWRQRQHAPIGKVCCRTRPDLTIHMGNHSASTNGTALIAPGLVIRHFSWRSEEQYLRKIRNGEKAYAATEMPESIGAHWRMFEHHDDETVRAHFRQWFYSQNPRRDSSLIYDPAPV